VLVLLTLIPWLGLFLLWSIRPQYFADGVVTNLFSYLRGWL